MRACARLGIANAVGKEVGSSSPFVDPSESLRVSLPFTPAVISLTKAAMRLWPFIRAFLGISIIFLVGVKGASAQTVGTVTKVQKQAQVGSTPAAVGTPVNMNVVLSTGIDARLQNIFIDDTTLTLGENARVVVDRYVFNPNTSTGSIILNTSSAALRFSTGKIGQMGNKDVTVNTPFAALSVRGTEFWAGFVDYKYGVVLLSSTGTRVGVSNAAGAEMLDAQYEGLDFEPSLKDTSAPGKPYIWDPAKIQRALTQTDIGLAFNPGMLTPGLIFIPLIPALDDDDDKPASP